MKSCENCRFGCNGQRTCVCLFSCPRNNYSSWKSMTAAQIIEKEMEAKSYLQDKKLVGDIEHGYSYVDTDVAALYIKINALQDRVFEELGCKKHVTDKLDSARYLSEVAKFFLNEKSNLKEEETMPVKKSSINYDKLYIKGSLFVQNNPEIKNVIFSGPCTIVQWSDGDKTVVKCENEEFDKEKGLAMAICKKFLGTNKTKSNYNDIFKKWIKEYPEEDKKEEKVKKAKYYTVKTYAENFGLSESSVRRMCRDGVINAHKQDGSWIICIQE